MEMLDEGPERAADIVAQQTGIPAYSARDFESFFFDASHGCFCSDMG